jgi:hypothetical protein
MTEQRNQEQCFDHLLPEDVDAQLNLVSQNRFDPTSTGELSVAIVSAIKRADETISGTDNLPPLYEVIDINALEEMCSWLNSDEDHIRHSTTVTFQYVGFLVVVSYDGIIQVYEPNETNRQNNQQPQPF